MNTHEIEDIRKQLVYAVDNDERSIIELQKLAELSISAIDWLTSSRELLLTEIARQAKKIEFLR